MTQKASDGFTLGTGNLSLPNLAQPNITTTTTVKIANNSIDTANRVHFCADGGIAVITSLVADFATAGTAGSRMWLVSGALGSDDADYIWVKDGKFGSGNEGNLLCSNASVKGVYTLHVKKDGSEFVWEPNTAHPDIGVVVPNSVYISLMSGKLLEVKYKDGAAASSDYVYATFDHSKKEGNDIIGANFGSDVTSTIETSSKACLVNVIS